jgi:hypothetical protein
MDRVVSMGRRPGVLVADPHVASDHAYRRGLRALAALADLELDSLVFSEAVELVVLDL